MSLKTRSFFPVDNYILAQPVHVYISSHYTLPGRLQIEFGVTGTTPSWLRSHLSERSQFVKLGRHQSPAVNLSVGVPQVSVPGPLLSAVYCSPEIAEQWKA